MSKFVQKIKNVGNAANIGKQAKQMIKGVASMPKEMLLAEHRNKMKKIQKHWIEQGDPLYDGPEFEHAMKMEWDRSGRYFTKSGMTYEEYLQASKEGIQDIEGITELQGLSKIIHKTVEKVGRNQKCPCGSGKKYKKCCGK